MNPKKAVLVFLGIIMVGCGPDDSNPRVDHERDVAKAAPADKQAAVKVSATILSAEAMCNLVKSANLSQINAAIRAGSDLKSLNSDQRTVLMEAVMWGLDPAIIATLLAGGSDPNTKGWYGRTALMWTGWSKTCSAETVATLHAHGADVNAIDDGGGTALQAILFDADRPDIVTALIAIGVDIQHVDKEGWTALDRARERHRDESVRVLIQAGALASGSMWAVLKTGSPAAIRLLVESTHLNVNLPEPLSSRIPVIDALGTNSDPAVVTELARLGANLSITDIWGDNPLLYAAQGNRNPDICTELIKNGVDVNVHNATTGETPLMLAVTFNEERAAVVDALMAAHADIQAKDAKGRTVLDYAEQNPNAPGMKQILAILKRQEAKHGNSFWTTVEYADVDTIVAALAAGADVNARDENGRTVLMWAVTRHRGADVITALAKAGARTNDTDQWGSTALMFTEGPVDVIAALVAAGADINARDAWGQTALIRAVANSRVGVISALLESGADPDLIAKDGKTALMRAQDAGLDTVVNLLRSHSKILPQEPNK